MKIVDGSKQQWAVDELDSEINTYSDLSEIWDMLRVMVLDDCGTCRMADWVAKATQEEYRARVVATATKQVEWKRAAAAKARAVAKAAAMAKARAQQEDEQAAFEADVREAVARMNKQNQRSRVPALLEERDVPDNQSIRSGDSDASRRGAWEKSHRDFLHEAKTLTGTQGARHLNCYLLGRAKAWWRRAFNAGQPYPVEMLFALVQNISPDSFETRFDTPEAVALEFAEELLVAAMGTDLLPRELLCMVARWCRRPTISWSYFS
ncbi:hypothetical protein HDU89_000701 [Geranomyces variabilis]|nr:hypothetical protein HDU89_000701 [Geranomyces variabilis]